MYIVVVDEPVRVRVRVRVSVRVRVRVTVRLFFRVWGVLFMQGRVVRHDVY